jgi:hypothetical protein
MTKAEELKKMRSTISTLKKGLIQSKVADFSKHASAAENCGLKAIVKKIQGFKKVIDAKNAKSNEKTIGKVKEVGDKLHLALAKKSDKIDADLKKIAEKAKAAKEKASKKAKAAKKPKASKAKSSKSSKPKASKKSKASPMPASFMWGGADESEEHEAQSELEFM